MSPLSPFQRRRYPPPLALTSLPLPLRLRLRSAAGLWSRVPELATHKCDECPQRLVNCELCDTRLRFEGLARHVINEKECVQCHLCKLGCGESVLDKQAADHAAKHCLHRLVRCGACVEKVERRHLEQHVQSNIVGHLIALSTKHTALALDNASLRQQLADEQKTVTSLEEQLAAAARAADENNGCLSYSVQQKTRALRIGQADCSVDR